jgi:hypothetical protein
MKTGTTKAELINLARAARDAIKKNDWQAALELNNTLFKELRARIEEAHHDDKLTNIRIKRVFDESHFGVYEEWRVFQGGIPKGQSLPTRDAALARAMELAAATGGRIVNEGDGNGNQQG